MRWYRKSTKHQTDAADWRESADALAAKAGEFRDAVHNLGMNEVIKNLHRRIEALETELRIMKNGTGTYPRVKL